MRATRDELDARYDRAIRLRADGLSYRDMAVEMGLGSGDEARNTYMQARAAQIPEDTSRTRPRPGGLVVAWAAGFFDGEGCVFGYEGVQSGGYRRFTFGVTASQVVSAPLEDLHHHWGGSLRHIPSRRLGQADQWHWSARGSDAAWFLDDVLPYLRVKDVAARAARPCLFRTHRHGVGFTEAEVAERREAIVVIRSQARKGKRG